EVEKIYAHESLTFNDTVTCKVTSKWKVGLKEDMVAQLVMLRYGLPKVCWIEQKNVLGMEIFKDQSGNTLRVSQPRPVSRDLGSLREETDEITDLYQILEEVLLTERGDGVACIKRHRRNPSSDDARDLVTASGHSRFNKDLESST
ncbi:hypothetical protein Tco_1558348, partial [Tanacetum coccineum]